MGGTLAGVVRIRPMEEADVATVHDLEVASFPQPWSVGLFTEELRQPGRCYVVAEDEDGRLAGYAGLVWAGDEAYLSNLAVVANQRRRRIGTRLLVRLLDEARLQGAKYLTLEVAVSNDSAIGLYRQFGLAPVGVRKRYYGDEDALVMWVHDIDSPTYRRLVDRLRRGDE